MSLTNSFTSKVRAFANKKGGAPEDARRSEDMLLIHERASDTNPDAEFTDKELKAGREWLARKLSRAEAAGMPFAEIVTVDPAIAHLLLQRNPADENRKLSLATVSKYANDMKAGLWKGLNGQTIVVSKDGYLNDGQHRLNAIIESDGRIPLTIVFGAERESRMTLDQNKIRTSGDYVSMAGVPNGNKVAAVAVIIHAYEHELFGGNGKLHADNRPTKAAIHAFAISRVEDILESIKLVDRKTARLLAHDTRLAAAHYILAHEADAEDASDFIERIIEGDNLGKTDPAFAARGRLLSERAARSSSVVRTLEIIFRAWNAHRRGERIYKMICTGNLPKIEA